MADASWSGFGKLQRMAEGWRCGIAYRSSVEIIFGVVRRLLAGSNRERASQLGLGHEFPNEVALGIAFWSGRAVVRSTGPSDIPRSKPVRAIG